MIRHRRAPGPRHPRRASSLRAGVALALAAAALLAGGGPASAAPNQLQNGSVSPGSGTTATTFTFSVAYQGNPPTNVSAVAGSVIVPLALAAGTPQDGTWVGKASLPAGTHAVSFEATAQGRDPSLAGPSVTVTPAPPPTPGPPPVPTPVPTAPPPAPVQTPVPTAPPLPPLPPPSAAASAGASASPAASASASADGSPTDAAPTPRSNGFVGGALATPTATPFVGASGVGLDLGDPGGAFAAALAAVTILSAIVIFSVFRDRRRRRRDDPRLALLPGAPATAADAPQRRRAEWEVYALDEQPIGTIEYVPPPTRRNGGPEDKP